jgi:beta-glucosidase-like glycosyl hydrolase
LSRACTKTQRTHVYPGIGSFLNVTNPSAVRALQECAVNETRLGIPLLFGLDVIHGFSTIFPVPLAAANTWDTAPNGLLERAARAAAREAAGSGLHWTFAPMCDVTRDARWGRVMEGAGEDAFLTGAVSAALVRGYQGRDLSARDTIAACAKHFVGYGLGESGREYNSVDVSEHTLHNTYLPPFLACVKAGVCSVMTAFNEINGKRHRDTVQDGTLTHTTHQVFRALHTLTCNARCLRALPRGDLMASSSATGTVWANWLHMAWQRTTRTLRSLQCMRSRAHVHHDPQYHTHPAHIHAHAHRAWTWICVAGRMESSYAFWCSRETLVRPVWMRLVGTRA